MDQRCHSVLRDTTRANLAISVIHESHRQETSTWDCEEKFSQNSCRDTKDECFQL
ncbi:hypothetical protein I79_000876 [Cricetulus griseus]|uniref:Uncharacterized protein n=1 Tax=Cricetulus griseus TaxID=10029 RepID=G3GTA0_CRIGR|nr:hypothetical protein I79_000876 [Cricetulus griseus]